MLLLIGIFYIFIGTFMESLAQLVLFTAVFLAVTIALISFAVMPGLQDPSTGSLPEAGARALAILPAAFIVGAALVFAFTRRRS